MTMKKNTDIITHEVITGILTMLVTGWLAGAVPTNLQDWTLVATLPFQLLGLWLVLRAGVEPTAYSLAEYLSERAD